jgi:2,4-diaminopentanoate dehydrogenase
MTGQMTHVDKAGVRLGLYGTGRTAAELVTALRSGPHMLKRGIVHAPHRAGKDLGELTIRRAIGIRATSDLEEVLRSGEIELLLYAGLGGPRHIEVMTLCAEYGVDMVHACFVHPRSSLSESVFAELDARARATGARIIGTGMIPGLWLDVLPALLSSGLPAPVSVEASRVSDISSWGADVLAQELGVGSGREGTAVEPDRALRESARMIADVLGLGDLVVREEVLLLGRLVRGRLCDVCEEGLGGFEGLWGLDIVLRGDGEGMLTCSGFIDSRALSPAATSSLEGPIVSIGR